MVVTTVLRTWGWSEGIGEVEYQVPGYSLEGGVGRIVATKMSKIDVYLCKLLFLQQKFHKHYKR